MFTAKSVDERFVKIGQHLPKLWARVRCPVFTHGVHIITPPPMIFNVVDTETTCSFPQMNSGSEAAAFSEKTN